MIISGFPVPELVEPKPPFLVRLGRIGMGATEGNTHGLPFSVLAAAIQRTDRGRLEWHPGLVLLPCCRRDWTGTDFSAPDGPWKLREDDPDDFQTIAREQRTYFERFSDAQGPEPKQAWQTSRWVFCTTRHHVRALGTRLPIHDLDEITAAWALTLASASAEAKALRGRGPPRAITVAPADVDYALRLREGGKRSFRKATLKWYADHFEPLKNDFKQHNLKAPAWTRKDLLDQTDRTLNQLSDRIAAWKTSREAHHIKPTLLVDQSAVVRSPADLVIWMRSEEFVRLLGVLAHGSDATCFPIVGGEETMAELAVGLRSFTLYAYQKESEGSPSPKVQWKFGEPASDDIAGMALAKQAWRPRLNRESGERLLAQYLPEAMDPSDLEDA